MSEIIDNIGFNPIIEIQIYLKEISTKIPEIVMTHTNGVFDYETKKAIATFQEIYGLPQTGAVDLTTWSKLVYEYDKIVNTTITPNKLDIFPRNIDEIKLGDKKDIVYIIQILINNFSRRYKNLESIDITGVYDKATESSVKRLQLMNKLPETGIVDVRTWNSLTCINNVCRFHEE